MNFWRLFDLVLFSGLGYLAGMKNDVGGLVVIVSLTLMFAFLEETP